MQRKSFLIAPTVAALALGVLGLTAQTASADPTPPAKGGPAAVAQSAGTPKSAVTQAAKPLVGYRQVTSALLTDPANSQTSGTASCPARTKLVGGGAVISSTGLAENINASVPLTDGRTWKVYINNASATAGTFRVYANCVSIPVAAYKVVVGTGVDNPAGSQSSATVSCPVGTVPLGGGGFASSGATSVNLNSSLPLSTGWRTDVNNASTGGNTATAYVVCGRKPTAYVQLSGTATTVDPGAQALAVASCPARTVVLSGGGFSSSGNTSVNLNSTFPRSSASWVSYEDNGAATANTVTTYAVCARTS